MKSAMPPLIEDNSQILILGTMPGEKSLELQQYYGNRGNHFWRLMAEVFHSEFTYDYEKRRELLRNNRIALWDVLATCQRHGSLDSNIKDEVPNNFKEFHEQFPNIRHVVFASMAAEKYYDRFSVRFPFISYYLLPSPSGANAGKTFAQKLEAWKILPTLLK